MKRMTLAEKMERRRRKRIGRMVNTAARKLHDVDFASGAASHAAFGGYDYAADVNLRAIVVRLLDNPKVRAIDVPRMAAAAYARGD